MVIVSSTVLVTCVLSDPALRVIKAYSVSGQLCGSCGQLVLTAVASATSQVRHKALLLPEARKNKTPPMVTRFAVS